MEIDIKQISDHAKVNIEINSKCNYKEAKRWKIDTNIFSYIYENIKKPRIWKIWKINEEGRGQPNLTWDIVKVRIRLSIIKIIY